ncbi:helix-turn-helix domain-containing protein [Halomarina salina]|uniref:Helix-turn-helix domain-containing protein n=1 Tax=Halomarina salina TaxID=1872699 RepID=A0ABD5RP16_9EURY|nr:helix-turn-helix domain-containing protein [Halomarina salina]
MRPNPSGDRNRDPASLAVGPQSPQETEAASDASPTVAELRLSAEDLALASSFERRPDLSIRVEPVAASRPAHPFSFAWVGGEGGDADPTQVRRGRGAREDDDVGGLLDALAADPTVDVRSVLARRSGMALCELGFCDHVSLVADVVTSRDGTVLSASATDGEWSLRVRYATREALAETVSTLDRFDVEARLSQIGCRSGSAGTDLTEKQRETVAVAFERGYFEIPRQVSLEDLAEELDVTHQALSERLRRAEQALLRAEFGD